MRRQVGGGAIFKEEGGCPGLPRGSKGEGPALLTQSLERGRGPGPPPSPGTGVSGRKDGT